MKIKLSNLTPETAVVLLSFAKGLNAHVVNIEGEDDEINRLFEIKRMVDQEQADDRREPS